MASSGLASCGSAADSKAVASDVKPLKLIALLEEGGSGGEFIGGEMTVFEQDDAWGVGAEVQLAKDFPVEALGVDVEHVEFMDMLDAEQIREAKGRDGDGANEGHDVHLKMLTDVVWVKATKLIEPHGEIREMLFGLVVEKEDFGGARCFGDGSVDQASAAENVGAVGPESLEKERDRLD